MLPKLRKRTGIGRVFGELRRGFWRAGRRMLSAVLAAAMMISAPARAQEFQQFVVEDIRIDGLRRFDPGVIFNRIDVQIGQTVGEDDSIAIINALFETGFFRSIDVLRDGNILVIAVEENPTIAEVSFSGVKEIPDETLEGMLTSAGIVKARVFDRALVEEAVNALEEIYVERNFYKVKVTPVVSPLPRNRVALLFEVDEGGQAGIRSIEITGNEEFSDWVLKRTMQLEPRGLLNFFGDSYLFSESRLEADLERIRTLYLENGYLRFQVEARQAEVSPDKEHIDLRIRLSEGQQYVLAEPGENTFVGDLPPEVTRDDLQELLQQVEGEIFSSQKSAETTQLIRDLLGDYGYAFAEVSYDNELNDEEGTVEVSYRVSPGAPAYVRRIVISGNERTRDEVIRREMLQFERERYSRKKVESSRRRIRRLGFFSDTTVSQEPVEGRDDELDLLVKVTETGAGNFHIGAGFSTDNNISFEAGVDTPNIFGSGNNFAADFAAGDSNKRINLSLDEYYYTDEGISRHMGISISERESSGNSSGYKIDGLAAEYGFGIPYADDGKYSAVFHYEKVKIDSISATRGTSTVTMTTTVGTVTTTTTMTVATCTGNTTHCEFEDKHGRSFDLLLLKTSLVHDTRDSFSQPTDGYKLDIAGDIGLPVLDLRYYKLDMVHDHYYQARRLWTQPVWHFRLGFGVGDGYGGDVYPFYQRYFVGGVSTLRGFDSNTIGGDKETGGRAIGGLSRVYGSLEAAIDTEFFKTQKVYLAPFVDAGTAGKKLGDYTPLRVSTGVEVRWISPIGPLRFSWSRALVKEDDDKTQDLQFSVRY